MIDKQNETDALTEVADAAFEATVKDVINKARQTGTDVVIWEDNEIVEVSPDEIERSLDERLQK
ncbi:MAG: hypothetical protein ABGZ53_21705 [Fuerstiella sp.]